MRRERQIFGVIVKENETSIGLFSVRTDAPNGIEVVL